jgi:hypothetical protein
LIITIFHPPSQGQGEKLEQVRELFKKAGHDDRYIPEFYNKMHHSDTSHYLYKAYFHVSQAMMAKFTSNLILKRSYFRSGRNGLEVVIRNHPDELELRFIRFMLQINIPSWLSYDNIETDILFFNTRGNNMNKLDSGDYAIIQYLENNGYI